MKKLIVLLLLAVVLISGCSQLNSKEKDLEIETLKSKIQNLETDKNLLNEQLEIKGKYEKLMFLGLEKTADAFGNQGHAEANYDYATFYYEESYFELCETFADACDTYYGYGFSYYKQAKGLFKEAKEYALDNKSIRLAELYENFSEYASQVNSELHEACEYFSSACNSYEKGHWDIGDDEIEEMNKHIEEHDRIIPIYNDYYADIMALMETL